MAMLKPKEMAKRLGVTVKTLQIWDKKGILKAHRTPTNRRYYTEEQYLEYILVNQRVIIARMLLMLEYRHMGKKMI